MKRRHDMPFGARFGRDATRFSLWAPGAQRIALRLGREGEARTLPMERTADGWHALEVAGVKAGDAYAFVLEDGTAVPDPASRSNPWDVGGPSAVVDPEAFDWPDAGWRGRPWHEAVVYELHVGTFTPGGTFAAAIEKLGHLAACGFTAIEVMPVADFAGERNWGYDGVLPFAPDAAYGTPEDLKRFVAAAHARGLMVLLDVVYNHFGPEGNYLPRYAPQFFNPAHQTPWGAAINFDGEHAQPVRDFFVHNALFWLEEYHFDGLRLDAVHAVIDESERHVVMDIAHAMRRLDRPNVHLVLENDANIASFLDRDQDSHATAQWNDDAHHAFHVLITGERDGYYRDYAERPAWYLGRTLAEGFAYQGDPSPHREGDRRGEPSAHLPLTAFMPFLQNHDQVGNRALGERLTLLAPEPALRLATATMLLAPSIPLVFMGEEFGARTPFLFFCDFHGELAGAVREGRRREFASFERFRDPQAREAIPDPGAPKTFADSKLDWASLAQPGHARWMSLYRELLTLRARLIVPLLREPQREARFEASGPSALGVDWTFADGSRLSLRANFSAAPAPVPPGGDGEPIFSLGMGAGRNLGPWSGIWTLEARP
jgi:malto-oligosyltrehalose trehalohydrolase